MNADYICDGQMSIFDLLRKEEPKSPILLHPGDKVYLVVRGDIEEHTVLNRTWGLSGGDRGYDLDSWQTWNSKIGRTTFTSYEDAEKAASEYIATNATDVILAKDIKPVKVVAYSYIFYEREIIYFYAILDDGTVYRHSDGTYDHISKDAEYEINYFEERMNMTKDRTDITILEDYKPTFKNMYKIDKKDNWLYAAARYQYFLL